MSTTDKTKIEYANIEPLRGISGFWLIPLLTLLIGLWMVYDNWASQGPLITIEFPHADGLEQGKTKIKTRNVDVGKVEKITLNDDLSGVQVSVRMNNEVSQLLVAGAKFWVVEPSIGLSGVSGLGTLLSGQYIEFSPGHGDKELDSFVGLEQAPLTPLGTPGLHVTLNTEGEFSFSAGDPILYQGYIVGKIEDVHFNTEERMIYYNAFIEAPYHKLVTTNTRFWDTTGIRVEVDQSGVSLQTGPLDAVIQGGISFSVPAGEPMGEPVLERAYYYIYSSRTASNEKKYLTSVPYVVMVDGSIEGLSAGAPVLYRGLPVGKVQRVEHFSTGQNLLKKGMLIPVFVELNPSQLGLSDTDEGREQAKTEVNQLITEGLVATLKSQNLLLGQKFIELSYSDLGTTAADAETTVAYFNSTPIIPSGKDSFSQILASVDGILAKANNLPLEGIGHNAKQLLADASGSLSKLDALLQSSEEVMANVSNEQLLGELKATLQEVKTLAASYSEDSKTNRDVRLLLQSASENLAELRPLLTELKHTPNGLIFTGSSSAEPEPMRKE